MNKIFVDTSGWYALIDQKDPDHPFAASWFSKNTFPLLTTNYILSETLTLLKMRLGHRKATSFANTLFKSKIIQIVTMTKEHDKAALQLFYKYADQSFSYVDCSSFAIMKLLNIQQALSFDRDFVRAGFISVP